MDYAQLTCGFVGSALRFQLPSVAFQLPLCCLEMVRKEPVGNGHRRRSPEGNASIDDVGETGEIAARSRAPIGRLAPRESPQGISPLQLLGRHSEDRRSAMGLKPYLRFLRESLATTVSLVVLCPLRCALDHQPLACASL